ncbi:hypothetical protein BHE74_00033533 [Ensete ventricosum]|nr:hypothetical protein BHE74_00033533 [Ensete ventricosum]
MSMNQKEGDRSVVNRSEDLTMVDFGGDESLAKKERAIMLEPQVRQKEAIVKRRSDMGQAQQNGWSKSNRWKTKASMEVQNLKIKTRRTRVQWERAKRRSSSCSKRSKGCSVSIALQKKKLAMPKEEVRSCRWITKGYHQRRRGSKSRLRQVHYERQSLEDAGCDQSIRDYYWEGTQRIEGAGGYISKGKERLAVLAEAQVDGFLLAAAATQLILARKVCSIWRRQPRRSDPVAESIGPTCAETTQPVGWKEVVWGLAIGRGTIAIGKQRDTTTASSLLRGRAEHRKTMGSGP